MIHENRFTLDKITSRLHLLEPMVYCQSWPLPDFKMKLFPQGSREVPLVEPQNDASWQTIAPYQYWGEWKKDFVLTSRFALPAETLGLSDLAFYLPLGESRDFSHPEALLYVDGDPFASCDRNHQEVCCPQIWRDGQPHTLSLHGWTGLGGSIFSEPTRLMMRPCKLVKVHSPLRELIGKLRVAIGSVRVMDENDPARARILNALDAALKVLDTSEPLGDDLYASVPMAQQVLDEGLAQAGAPLDVDIFASGHAHIDVAWLWPLVVTRQKAARTFQNALNLMKQFSDFHFSQSQPQLYEFVRQDFPELFAQIQQQVSAGRWEVLGGLWLEADCNLSGAESLARQFLLGRSYFENHFGADAETPVLWLPDAFGFCASLPQLIHLAGLKYFFTIKLSWNQTNRLPFDTFWWQGLDGSRVLSHFSTTPSVGSEWKAATYNAEVEPGQVLATWQNFQQKELPANLLMAYGFGDGGGGPTREMNENRRILANFPGMPRVRSASVRQFFEQVDQDTHLLPTWNGELYLELHRGTFTSQSRNKRANRKSEFALHDAEFAASLASLLNPDYAIPQEELTHAWQIVCLNQFHDILPGSSIEQVYAESQAQYQEVQQSAQAISTTALNQAVAANRAANANNDTSIWLLNPTSFSREDLVFVPGDFNASINFSRNGEKLASQPCAGGVWVAPGEVKAYSLTEMNVISSTEVQKPVDPVKADSHRLENQFMLVEFNDSGEIVRLFDKINQREVLPPSALANQWQAFDDRPVNWDAWDLDRSYEDKPLSAHRECTVSVAEAGPLRATLLLRGRFLHSTFEQRISLAYNSPRLDFDTRIDWREKHTLLKVAFPVEVLADQASYEIQWGYVHRPTHENTSWDWARFETCAHKWVDLSEGNYGVSLLNDCKYGHDIHGNMLRLSLLRSPTEPDAHADEGEHRFVYSLLPHSGALSEKTISAAYALNDPWLLMQAPASADRNKEFSLVSADCPNAVIETIKPAEDSRGLILRLYESQSCRGPVMLTFGKLLSTAWRCDLLEHDLEELPAQANSLQIDLQPFQIVNLRLIFEP